MRILCSVTRYQNLSANYRLAKKVIHCQESYLNRIKTVIKAKFFINFDYKMSKTI